MTRITVAFPALAWHYAVNTKSCNVALLEWFK